MLHHTLAILFAAAVPVGVAAAQTTINVPCNLDNTLYFELSGGLSNGIGDSVFVGVTAAGRPRRAVLSFDIASAVPAGSRILAATLTLHVEQTTAFLPVPANLHRLTQSWGEGTSNAGGPHGGSGTLSTPGDATWLHRSYPNSLWTTPGGDFMSTATCGIALPNQGNATSSAPDSAAIDVQAWLDTPAQNFGWLLKAVSESQPSTAHRIASRHSSLLPPSLSVTYLAPGQNGTWGSGCPQGTGTITTAFVGAPIGGTTIQITQSNTVPLAIGANFYSLGLATAGVPLGLPGCSIYLPLNEPIAIGDVFVTTATGTCATSTLGIPSGFPGVLVACQAVVLDNNPVGLLLGNAALIVLQ